MASSHGVKTAVSAGGVVYREKNKKIEVVLIVPSGGKAKSLPKGTIKETENVESAALREVEEETGIKAEIVEKLGTIDYWFYSYEDKRKIHKYVHYFLMKYVSGNTANHDWEVEDASWYEINKAIKVAEYENERKTLKQAKDRISN